MPYSHTLDLQKLLEHPEIRKAITDENREILNRKAYAPPICKAFEAPYTTLRDSDEYRFTIDPEAKKRLPNIIDKKVQTIHGMDSLDAKARQHFRKPRRIGIVFSGGPAPGGHNVIAGVFDACRKANPESRLFGFFLGPDGIIENEAIELTPEMVDRHRNLGGFTMIKTGRTKIDNKKKVAMSLRTCKDLGLDALVVVGGDDSNTNAAFLAQEMHDEGIQVIGVPKTIDGDIQVRDAAGKILCAMSFGFHTAALSFARSISNLCTDSSSDVKYWHVCKVMGRVASHLALEVALQTHANITLIGEDLSDYIDLDRIEKAEKEGVMDYSAYGMTLRHLSRVICDGIVRRAAVGKNYGVIVIPEGVLDFINEIQMFITKLNMIIADYNRTHDTTFHQDFLTLDEKLEYLRRLARRSREESSFRIWNTRDDDLFNVLPAFFQEGLLTERDSHGNFQFSQVPTETVVMGLVKDYLNRLFENGAYKIGIHLDYYRKTMEIEKLDADFWGPVLFRNYGSADYLLFHEAIISKKTLKQALEKGGRLKKDQDIPAAIEKLFNKSVPNFKTQVYFYGYDGRGEDPSRFDCDYTYNLGLTVFSLIANGATGVMAAIRNLEKEFVHWEPMGVPIAPLMHLEERKGKLELVLEKSLVDVNAPAFRVAKAMREKWLAAEPGADHFRRPNANRLEKNGDDPRPITLILNNAGAKGSGE